MKKLVILRETDHPELRERWLQKASETMSSVHPNRRREWVSGRVALTVALRELNVDISPEARFEGYQEIAGVPLRFSISHTEGYAGALVSDKNENPGLDIENIGRKVDQKIFERFSHPEDAALNWLLLWSVKEAAYKTLPSSLQEKIWLQSIQVSEGFFSGEGFSGEWEQVTHPGLIIVQAFRTK